MGGQACVFYGAAQVSKDVDFLVLGEPENFARLQAALPSCRQTGSPFRRSTRQPWTVGMRFTFGVAHRPRKACGWT